MNTPPLSRNKQKTSIKLELNIVLYFLSSFDYKKMVQLFNCICFIYVTGRLLSTGTYIALCFHKDVIIKF